MQRLIGNYRVVLAICLIVALALMMPALISPRALAGDAPVHVLWQAHFAAEVWRGNLYPRWLPDMNYGFGSPAFFFYPPLLQWTGSLFAALLPGPEHASDRINLALWLLSAAGGFGTWAWLRALKLPATAALFGALAYLLLPYRAYFDVYWRGALPELTGIAVMPWLLCFVQQMKLGARGAWSGLASATGLLFYSHLPAAEMGVLFAGGYVLALAEGDERLRWWWRTGSGLACGFLIGGLSIAPALGLLRHIPDPANMWGERQQPFHWLLFSKEVWKEASIRPTVALLCLFTLGATLVLTPLALRERAPGLRRVIWFLGASLMVVLLLNTELARAFWVLQTPLSRVQFPFRLLSVTSMAIAGLGAIALAACLPIAPRAVPLLWASLPALLLADTTLLVTHENHRRFVPKTNAEIVADTTDTGEYILGSLKQVRPMFDGDDPRLLHGAATARLVSKASRHRSYMVEASRESILAIPQFNFSGWLCRIDGGAWSPAASPAEPRRVVVCGVPAGRHRLDVMLPATLPERAGAIALIVGLALAGINLLGLRRRS